MNNGNNIKSRKNEIDYEKGIEDSMRNGKECVNLENDRLVGNLLKNMQNIKGIAHSIL
jgi:hypothetical protein